ncbi:MAG: hypothetical protein VB027_08315 [Gordonibacter sp.]|nr:hypothetical protein [Gordonibacter sp.]
MVGFRVWRRHAVAVTVASATKPITTNTAVGALSPVATNAFGLSVITVPVVLLLVDELPPSPATAFAVMGGRGMN